MGKLKKFETFSDSVVVETLKVMIIVVVEAGFPCIPVILESEGRGGHLFERGVFIWYYGQREGHISDCRHLFKEVWFMENYHICQLWIERLKYI